MNGLSRKEIIQQTIALTAAMELNFPELYQFLDETPMVITGRLDENICTADFEKYLETLEDQVINHIKTHPHILLAYFKIAVTDLCH